MEDFPYASGFCGYKDWFIQHGHTIVVGKKISPLPLSRFNEIFQDNPGMLTRAVILT